jgi:hypothetical protein
MPSLHTFVVRDDGQSALTPTTIGLLIALVVLFAVIALLVGTLLILRQMRRTKQEREQREQEALPMYIEKAASSARSSKLTITTSSYAVHDKETLVDSGSLSPPACGVPEIRITFPEEVDESGKRMSGRVVVVNMGDHSGGLEPVHEQLPPYEQRGGGRFESLDLDRIGGLKEKEMR